MIGAILGDIIGSPYEFDRGNKTKDFPLFSRASQFTDDTVMTIAVANAVLDWIDTGNAEELPCMLVSEMQTWGRRFPDAGYGGMFRHWLREKDPAPYNSFGNGSAMRVSSAGWLFESRADTVRIAAETAKVTHNHPEGIYGACAVAEAIWMSRNAISKEEIAHSIHDHYGYDLERSLDEIRPWYHHVESCQETVPEAIIAFLEGVSFEDVIRNAVSLGGDCDTLTCIAGSIAEAYYGVPEWLQAECMKRIPQEMRDIVERFNRKRIRRR